MDITDATPIGTRCVRCDGQANVLIEKVLREGWTPDAAAMETQWTCPRCQAVNTIVAPGRVVGIAFATGHMIVGKDVPP
jgi:hypothetical protein